MTFHRAFLSIVLIGSVSLPRPGLAHDLEHAHLRMFPETGSGSHADTERAKSAFLVGERAFEAGRYAEAAERFEYAYELCHRAELLFDVGLAADRLRDDDRALTAFEGYLAASENSVLHDQVSKRVAALKAARAEKLAPAPAQVASAAMQTEAPAARPAREPLHDEPPVTRDDASVLSQWWFWAGAALLIAGGTTAVVVAARGKEPALPRPNTGVIVSTLRLAP